MWVAGTTDRRLPGALLCAALVWLPAPAASDHEHAWDYERARALQAEGRILSLREITEALEVPPGARLLKTEFEREDGRWVYEFEYLIEGEVWEYEVDAATGELLEVERD